MKQFIENLASWGREFDQAAYWSLIYLILGLIVVVLIRKLVKFLVQKYPQRRRAIRIVGYVIYGLFVLWIIAEVATSLGLPQRDFIRVLILFLLAAVALYMLLRPLFPTMPFQIGHTVLAAGLFGKVEAIDFFNTRLRTFDGKTIFVPNTKILNQNFINYHFTPNRRVHLDVVIRYQDDLARAKELMVELMTADERVLKTVQPMVYVTKLGDFGVHLGGRCWVPNVKYWRTRCDLLEQIKLRFDQEPDVSIAYPHYEVAVQSEAPEEI
jgi:small conductance mechanosensitive channel